MASIQQSCSRRCSPSLAAESHWAGGSGAHNAWRLRAVASMFGGGLVGAALTLRTVGLTPLVVAAIPGRSRLRFPARRPGQPMQPCTLAPALGAYCIPVQNDRTAAIRQLVPSQPQHRSLRGCWATTTRTLASSSLRAAAAGHVPGGQTRSPISRPRRCRRQCPQECSNEHETVPLRLPRYRRPAAHGGGVAGSSNPGRDSWLRHLRLVSDHFATAYAPLLVLQMVATSTSMLRLATLVLDNDFRHPAVLAKEATTLDLAFNSRPGESKTGPWVARRLRTCGLKQRWRVREASCSRD
jgi:hypothetical protein